ncbi:MAG: hypothetical protein Q9160_003730 [Pyrenula sp. 1 TL-2023]
MSSPTQQQPQDDRWNEEQELQIQGHHQNQRHQRRQQLLQYPQTVGQLSQYHYQQHEYPRRYTNSMSNPDSGRSAVANTLSSGGFGPLEPGNDTDASKTLPGNKATGFVQPQLAWFQVGKIFKAPCAEYASDRAIFAARQREDDSLSSFTTSAFEGLSTFHEVRHYIIVLVKDYHSLCLAYHTYGGQGTKKPSIEAEDHAIIYSGRRCPELLRGEPRLSKDPIRVINERKQLHPASQDGSESIYSLSPFSDTPFLPAFDPGAERPQPNVIVLPSGRKSAINSASATAEILQEHLQQVIVARETPPRSLSDHDVGESSTIGALPNQHGLPEFYGEHATSNGSKSGLSSLISGGSANASGIETREYRENAIRSTPGDMEKVDWRRSGPPVDILLVYNAIFRLPKGPKSQEVF